MLIRLVPISRKIAGMNTKNYLNPLSLKALISSPIVYKPLVLITLLNCLLQCSGSVFIKKFMIQILNTQSSSGSDKNESNTLVFALPLIITSVRLAVLLFMSFLVKKLRVRFLYFTSLFITVILLICLALASDPTLIGLDLPDTTLKWIKTSIICIHVFSIQLGLNTLPRLLEITIFPTSCKAAMKGIMRAIYSIILVIFVFVFKTLQYSHIFFFMAGILLVSSPLLYLYVPEIRNIGSETATEFFLPSQTIFYYLPPKYRSINRNKQAMENWSSPIRKISAHQAQVSQESEFFRRRIK